MYQLASIQINCPYCGESIEILADNSIPEQIYIEDCPVCCRPITLHVSCDESTCRVNKVLRDDEC
ncbi:MAG: CPXCG motif-containing cysteine-rich protein [Candidatus Thiodiazotropha sp. (ex Monitilora ramsayi)]|nr:CPXCG motif-containing cysteine-rich protein [Candidatus Thiodiazotropha sp. (ex Monitilora ramsayi)]